MAATVTATVGSASANSYLTVAAADSIADTVLDISAWSSATSDEKSRALITATRDLDTLDWIGNRTTTTQALDWPRTDASCGGIDYPDDEIPEAIRYATFELASNLLVKFFQSPSSSDASIIPGIPNRDLSSLKLDVMEIRWRTDTSSASQATVSPLSALPHLSTILGCLTTSTIPGSTGRILSRVRS